MTTRVHAALMAASIVLLLLFSPALAQNQPRSGGELVFMVPSEPPSYDGHKEGTFGVVHPLAPHYSTLLRVDPTDRSGTKVIGDLAETWTISADGLVYTLKLRQGVRFHDGSVMTSRDVKASYDKIVFPPAETSSYRKGQYRVVEAVEAPDASTIRFRLKWPEASFLMTLASPYSWIYKADILAKDIRWYEKNVMGTGPFVFVEHVKGSHWIGKKNPAYWDRGKPYLDGFRALFVSSSAAQVAAIRGERAHIQFRSFSPSERDTLVAALGPKITVQESPWDCSMLLAMNHERKPWDDKRVRRALTLALDRYAGARNLSRIAVVKDVAGIPGARHTVGDAAAGAREAGGLRARHQGQPRRGAPAAPRGGHPGRLCFHVPESRHPAALRAARHLAHRSVAADRAQRAAGDDRGVGLSSDAPARRLRRRDGFSVQLRDRARHGHR